jgi:LysM repeat protein
MNSKKSLIYIVFTLFILNFQFCNAQQDFPKVFVDGHEFYVHKVSRGETLFGISQIYNVDVKDIVVWNPMASQGLKKGMVLRIPIKIAEEVTQGDNFIYHRVESHETLFFIAQKYNVSIESIYGANPDLKKEGLKAGMTIKIPDTKQISNAEMQLVPAQTDSIAKAAIVEFQTNPCDSFYYDKVSDTLRVALMLPLYLNYNQFDSTSYSQFSYYKDSKRFFDIYKGVLMAMDELKKQINVKLYVYDTENNASAVVRILDRPEFRNIDLIIGPVYSKNIELVAQYAQTHHVNMVSILSKGNQILSNTPYVFQVNPSDETRVEQTALYLSNFYDSSIVALHSGTMKETDLIQLYKQKIVDAYQRNNALNTIVFKDVNYKLQGLDAIEDALSVGLKNIVLITSTREADVMEMLTKLDYLANFYDITVYGMPEWEVFDNVELDLFTRLKTNYPTSTYINYQNANIKAFVDIYHQNFIDEPSIYAFLGHDVGYFFMEVYKNHGKNFQNCMQSPDIKKYNTGLMSYFDFRTTAKGSGFENFGIYILEYQTDYTLKVKAGGNANGYFIDK